jgi:immune inhibitor A
VRFEVVTDDAINQPGLVIDDVSIPEIGYQSDFELDGGGWDAAGWVRTDNRLPQQVWVQAAQQIGNQVQVSRWLAPAENHWSLPLADGVQQVLIAISPFAPVTTVATTYTLTVSAH